MIYAFATRQKSTSLPKSYPPKPETRAVRLRGRITGIINVAPDSAHIPINTSLPSLIFPDGTPIHRPTTFRPPYLTHQIAKHLDIYTNDPYMITRSIELFGSPWSAAWVANLSMGESTRETVVVWTNNFLRVLPWHHEQVQPLTDAAWAEHLLAMQNPRLQNGRDDSEYRDEQREQAINPLWPEDTPRAQDLSLSWSSSTERDTPFIRNPSHRAFLPPGRQTYPRPKRIERFYAWDDHLILTFASPTARRAVLAAYAWWLRRKLVDAYRDKDKPGTPVVFPPVDLQELTLGEVLVGSEEREAMSWAREVGWRPEYRIRPYRGRRKKNDDGEGWYKTEIETRRRVRERKRALERKQLEVSQENQVEAGDLDSQGSNLDGKR
ncbi:hypothetical protein RSOL_423530 [Rhizoctonia solani AG-3 Rhs1AP]|uniref:Uncharacterized protein n=1 Tax=Rhizoctonia solani AG-3 Rhs1AP TaxID=1086054 RepID=X8JFQ1_9AGAM|nr:hypothetical protein RSOL_423530 [Rhizoctonia solani AG-3 Rhs1AP]